MGEHSSDLNYPAESVLLAKASRETPCQATEEKTDTFRWTSCGDFTVEVGKQQINAYIQTWELRPCWLHGLDFLFSTEEEHGARFYHYRARFSTPTAREPIPDTASVYFLVEVAQGKAQTLPVEVRFMVESNRLVHTAGESRFSEKWLSDIIQGKASVRRMIDLYSSRS
ncbi:A-kinase anchor protein 14 [Kryptolebias marmoratus]|uniref:A-kinase anchor protein 14 n=1 Tax=Kryptolebias marmoratus TaxID=37003 RepID=UPI0007F8F076|nr:A-kinase anchor protein 14 [Kryptolebias marmoratus]